MREIKTTTIIEAVKKLCIEANYKLGQDVLNSLEISLLLEESPLGIEILKNLKENAEIAKQGCWPICQDTGIAVFFLEMGQNVRIVGGDLYEAINKGVRQGYSEGCLRKSIVSDPLERLNTNDNSPAVIHLELVPGDKLKIFFTPKGAGSENMSQIKMLSPADGIDGVKKFVIQCVKESGANPCPPIVVGVGIGGSFEKAAILSKKALLRPLSCPNTEPKYAFLEKEITHEINRLGIGPEGFGGRVTALAVHIETYPCHMASLPVAVNISCYAYRHKEIEI